MSNVARICKASKQRGNALVLLLLLKTWGGEGAPDVYELADLAHISPRQAERDLQKLIDDGEAERIAPEVKGRGHVTRFRLKESPSHVSDKSPSHVTDFISEEITPSHPSDIQETTSDMTDLSDVKPATSDGLTSQKHDTSDGTRVAPFKVLRTSTEKNIINRDNARATPAAFTHEVSPPVQVYRDVFGTDPPAYGQDQIEQGVVDLDLWRETCKQWKGNDNDRTKVWNMVDAYKKKVKADVNGNGTAKQAQRTHGAGKQLPRTPEPVNREWPVKNRV